MLGSSKFQRVSRIGFVTAPPTNDGQQRSTKLCTMFGHLLGWNSVYRLHFRGLLPPNGILPRAKFTLRQRLAFSYIGCVTARHSSSGCQPKFEGITEHSLLLCATYVRQGGHHVGHRPTFSLILFHRYSTDIRRQR